MAEISCPSCGTASHYESMKRDSSEFCRVCDYPLFWVRSAVLAGVVGDGEAESGLRRLPGTAGRMLAASIPCPNCTEPNLVTATVCIRCGADMHPKPVVVEAPAPKPEPVPEPEPVSVPLQIPWILIAIVVTTLIAGFAVLLIR
jgi:hypothetical protein